MKQITCLFCPLGCRLTIENKPGHESAVDQKISLDFCIVETKERLQLSGNKCTKGVEFAIAELTSPTRSLATTVRTVFPKMPVLPVKTSADVPKEKIFLIISELSRIIINRRVGIGETIIENILETGCDIIVTSNALKE